MANQLEMTIVQSILLLHAQGWSGRRIAATLEIDRETVSRYVRQQQAAASKPANAPIFPAGCSANSKPAIPPIGPEPAGEPLPPVPSDPPSSVTDEPFSEPKPAPAPVPTLAPQRAHAPINRPGSGRTSDCIPWREFILAQRAEGLSAKRIHQDLVVQPGAEAISYDSVRRFLKRYTNPRPLPFRRMECTPGEEAQVDFGSGAPVITVDPVTGAVKRRKTNVFRIVLSHSRKAYSEATFTQTTEDFIRCLETISAACHRRW